MRSVVFLLLLCFFHAQSISAMDLVCRLLGFSSGVKEQSLAVNPLAAADEDEEGYEIVRLEDPAGTSDSDNDEIVPGGQGQQQQSLPVEAPLTSAETVAHQPAVVLPTPDPIKLTFAQVVARANIKSK
ncbi:MAG: hypothetical protein LVQ75_04690 [Candidatus Babeliales bacterium]|jgi:hypothetical protein